MIEYGITNSVVKMSEEGERKDVVIWVENRTGEKILPDTKLWINRHSVANDAEVTHYATSVQNKGQVIYPWWVNGISYFWQDGKVKRIFFNYETSDWEVLDVATLASVSGILMNMNGLTWVKKHYYGWVMGTHGEILELPGYLLSDKYIVSKASPYYLGKYDKETNTISELSEFSVKLANNERAFVDGDTLLVTSAQTGYTFYHISDLNNISTLSTGTLALTSGVFKYVTGLKVGDYVIKNAETDGNAGGVLLIFKITSGYQLEYAEDLPPELQAMQLQTVNVRYNNETNILSVGTTETLQFYRFVGGKFVPLNINVNLPTLNAGKGLYYGHLSPDMSTLVVYGERFSSTSYTYYSANYFCLKSADNNWYAEPYFMSNGQSLIGFATGNVDNEGRYEARTVYLAEAIFGLSIILPDKVFVTGGVDD